MFVVQTLNMPTMANPFYLFEPDLQSQPLQLNLARLPQSKSTQLGGVPFNCDKLLACKDIPSQTCGCVNNLDSEKLAIVYNLRSNGN